MQIKKDFKIPKSIYTYQLLNLIKIINKKEAFPR